jgi:hypothetical protein
MELARLQRILTAGLAKTAASWPDLQRAYAWVHRAAHLLANAAGRDVFALRREYRDLLAEMRREQETLGALMPAIPYFRKVTRSYWPGLFACYTTPGLPRTNNDLEHCLGSARYHERRATGRRGASPTLVVRGQVRSVAALASGGPPLDAAALRPSDLPAWRSLRRTLETRHQARRAQCRFRRNPTRYLLTLEELLLTSSLPS